MFYLLERVADHLIQDHMVLSWLTTYFHLDLYFRSEFFTDRILG
jgi:hypothetical protein